MEIRYANRGELPQVSELLRQVQTLHAQGRPDIFRDDFPKELVDHLYEKFDAEDSDVIVAVSGGEVCGYVVAEYIHRPGNPFNIPRSYYHIEEIAVDSTCRRQGIASKLVEFCRDEAKRMGFSKIQLDMWEFNQGALACYEALGFTTFRRYMETDL